MTDSQIKRRLPSVQETPIILGDSLYYGSLLNKCTSPIILADSQKKRPYQNNGRDLKLLEPPKKLVDSQKKKNVF
jgi:hypothetical protein